MALLDAHTLRVIDANEAACSFYGYARSEASALRIDDVSLVEVPELAVRVQRALSQGGRYPSVHRLRSGELRDVEVALSPVPDSDPPLVFAIIQDVTPRVTAENALAEREARFRLLAENATDLIATHDAVGIFVYASPASERLLGFRLEDLVGEALTTFVHPEDQDLVEAAFRELSGSLEGTTVAYRIRRSDRRFTWFETTLRRVESSTQRGNACVVAVSRDISDRKRAEQALHSTEEQLQQAQKMETVGRLAGGMAHDFNNLLTAIRGNAEFLHADLGPESPLRSDIEQIEHAAERAASLTRQLLAFSRKHVRKLETLELNEVIREIGRMLRRLIGEDIEVFFQLNGVNSWVFADQSQVEQVILNLAINARDAMPSGGKLYIETQNVEPGTLGGHTPVPAGRLVLLSIIDTGFGMDDATRKRAFEPFFTTKEEHRGTGLGLVSVRGIVHQAGGMVWLESEVGHGTAVRIVLPCMESASAREPPSARQPMEAGSGTVLLVEDEELVRTLARRVLERTGYTVVEVAGAHEALERWARQRFDVVVTDVVMPGMGGKELVAQLRKERPSVPVVYMSGYAEDAPSALGLGPRTAFVEKPFTGTGLAECVRDVMRV